MTEQVKKLIKDIKSYTKKVMKYSDLRRKAENELQLVCTHEDKEKKVKHYEGSYLNYGSYEYTTKCNICGLILETKTESDGHYG